MRLPIQASGLRRIFILLLMPLVLFAPKTVVAEDWQTDIIYSPRADELASILRTLAGDEGSISVYQDQLIIRASAHMMPLLREQLAKLDRPLKTLRISVRRAAAQQTRQQATQAQLSIQQQGSSSQTRITLAAAAQDSAQDKAQGYSISAEEGSTVTLYTGSSQPYLVSTASGQLAQQFQPIESGITLTPRLREDGRIQLAIAVQQAQPLGAGGAFQQERSESQLSLRPGEWTALSALGEIRQIQRNSAGHYQAHTANTMAVEVRIEVMP